MSRHGRHVPTSFYRRFARDALTFADEHAKGRLISVLEGGYSDRALTSGVMSWIAGLAEGPSVQVKTDSTLGQNSGTKHAEVEYKTGVGGGALADENWWKLENLIAVSKNGAEPVCTPF